MTLELVPKGSPEDLVAFHGPVVFKNWSIKSSQDPKVIFGLESRDDLCHFDEATRRRGKRAGQRYRLIWADKTGDPIVDMPDECWLWGSSWSHTQGATIALALTFDDWLAFALRWIEGHEVYVTMVEIQDDETPVDQVKAARLVGGPISRNCGMMCRDPAFVYYCKLDGYDDPADRVRAFCQIDSRAELDHDKEAAERWARLKSSFLRDTNQ